MSSKEFRVITQYLRTVHHLRLREDDIKELVLPILAVPSTPSKISLTNSSSSFMRSVKSGVPSMHPDDLQRTMTMAVHSELLQASVYTVQRQGKVTFYAWLEPSRWKHYCTPNGERELTAVLAVLGDRDLKEEAI
mmetsp:Transcript_23523/g.53634  ORF Transcript_23523/g.53634 Transcript_23523/m.53634 type:complete len:135 (-) Transcript_23523:108-512(-)